MTFNFEYCHWFCPWPHDGSGGGQGKVQQQIMQPPDWQFTLHNSASSTVQVCTTSNSFQPTAAQQLLEIQKTLDRTSLLEAATEIKAIFHPILPALCTFHSWTDRFKVRERNNSESCKRSEIIKKMETVVYLVDFFCFSVKILRLISRQQGLHHKRNQGYSGTVPTLKDTRLFL